MKRMKFKKEHLELYSLLAIPVIVVFVFCYLPMGGIIIAFKNFKFNKGIFGSEWVGLKNFEIFFKSDVILRITRNTLVMNSLFIVASLICAVIVASLLYEIVSRKFVKIFQTIMITPSFISWVIASYMVYALLSPTEGTINTLIEFFGGTSVEWYSEPQYWPVILTVCNVWKGVGMESIWYYAAFMGVDTELLEAARIDGANKWQVYRYIMIPLIVPIIIIRQILAIGGIFRSDFGLFYQVTKDSPFLYGTTDVIDTYIFRAMKGGKMAMSTAVGLLQSAIGFVMVMITNSIARKINPDNALF